MMIVFVQITVQEGMDVNFVEQLEKRMIEARYFFN